MTSPAPRPAVGRIVHYVSHGSPVREDGTQAYTSECRAAIVTEVDRYDGPDGAGFLVGLCVLNPTGQFFNRAVEHDPGTGKHVVDSRLCDQQDVAGGTWHWPARV